MSKSFKKPSADFNGPDERRLWGRRMGRPLKRDRLDALENILPQVEIPKNKLTMERDVDPASLFQKPFQEFWFEIGFGNGEHVHALKNKNPDIGFIGAEPFVNGMSNLLKDITHEPLDNIRLHMDDAMLVIRSLKDDCLGRIYILNPDPWPKVRHYKRRIVSPKNLDEFARVLKSGGELILTTDVADLADWMVTHTFNHPAFIWQARRADDWRIPPADWIPTRYEIKQANHSSKKMAYMFFKRK